MRECCGLLQRLRSRSLGRDRDSNPGAGLDPMGIVQLIHLHQDWHGGSVPLGDGRQCLASTDPVLAPCYVTCLGSFRVNPQSVAGVNTGAVQVVPTLQILGAHPMGASDIPEGVAAPDDIM